MQTLYVMQGLPGAGKSTLARRMARLADAVICSTDSYFYQDGVYLFDPTLLPQHHAENLRKAIELLVAGHSVIVDNTNIKRVHVRPYALAAHQLSIPVVFIRVTGPFHSEHGVPDRVIDRMRVEMEDLTLESVLAAEEVNA